MSLKNIVCLVTLLGALSSHALTVISDLDDTIKITRVKTLDAIKNGLFSTRTFLGMPELLRSLKAGDDQNLLHVVSGSPDLVRGPVENLLSVNEIEVTSVHLLNGTSKKPTALSKLVESTDDDVILLGDDQEKDPYFYADLKKQYPEKIKAIYIHQLNERNLPEGQIGFLTAYEVAAHEAAAGRMSFNDLAKVKNFIIERLDFKDNDPFISRRISELLIPDWQECSARSVRKVLSTTRALSESDQDFLNRVEKIAIRNCD